MRRLRVALAIASFSRLAWAGPPGTYSERPKDDPEAYEAWKRAQDPPAAKDENAVSYKPWSITSRGLTLQYERLVLRKLSLVGGLGFRSAAREDYSSWTNVVVLEARRWLLDGDWATGYPGMAGLYLGFAFDAGRTSVRSVRDDRSLGALWVLQESFRFGNRWVFWDLQEISVAIGLDLIHDFDEKGRLAPNTHGTVGMDFTVGWVF
jgi:hypothetical protein